MFDGMSDELKKNRAKYARGQANSSAYGWNGLIQTGISKRQRVTGVDVRQDILGSIAPKDSGKGKRKSPFDFQ